MSVTVDSQVKRICIVNRLSPSNQLDQEKEILPTLRAIQKQLNEEFRNYWALSAKLYYCGPNVAAPTNMWSSFLLDSSDVAGALGYHDTRQDGIPQSKTFVKTAKNSGAKWSITLDHEILEMLADTWGMESFFQDFTSGMKRLVAKEVCDPCEADKYGYQKDGIWLSNFVTPYWYHSFKDIAEYDNEIRYDYRGIIKDSFTTLPGCHQSYYYIAGAPRGTPIQAWSSKNFKLGQVEEIYSDPQQNGWVITFKTPSEQLVKEFDITEDEVLGAIESAFNPPAGSRRDIRFKGYNHLQANNAPLETKLEDPIVGQNIIEIQI